jgi:hypothetical protein
MQVACSNDKNTERAICFNSVIRNVYFALENRVLWASGSDSLRGVGL